MNIMLRCTKNDSLDTSIIIIADSILSIDGEKFDFGTEDGEFRSIAEESGWKILSAIRTNGVLYVEAHKNFTGKNGDYSNSYDLGYVDYAVGASL